MKDKSYSCPTVEILSFGDLDVIVTFEIFSSEDRDDIFDDL